jgi:predicted ATPase
VDWERHPYNVPAVRDLSALDFHPDVTFFIGENGAGKSTLLEAIALALGFSIDGGSRNVSNLNTARERAPLAQSLRLSKSFKTPRDRYFFRAESFHNVATRMDEYYERSASRADSCTRSHGEAFMSVLLDTFRGHGLYLLDEPEAALSPNRQLAALRVIHQLVAQDSQFIITTIRRFYWPIPTRRSCCSTAPASPRWRTRIRSTTR